MQSNAYNSKQQRKRFDDEDWSEVREDKKAKKPKKDDYSGQRKNKRGENDNWLIQETTTRTLLQLL